MAENEVAALIAQIRKVLELIGKPGPLSEEQKLEFRTAEALIVAFVSHRGADYPKLTREQALELATVMQQTREAAHAHSIQSAPLEDLRAKVRALIRAPAPEKN
jgi:hypothetical protein